MYEEITGKKQLSLFVFWSPNQKGDWNSFLPHQWSRWRATAIFFFRMWQMSDLRHGLNVKKDSPCFFQVHQGHGSLLLAHVGNTSHTAVALALFPLQSTPRGLFHFFQLSAQEGGRTPARERAEIEGRLLCMIRRRYSRGSFISQGKSLP